MERLVEIEKLPIEKEEDNLLRPSLWNDYIGQENIKKNLKVFIAAAKKRDEVLDHILFFGPPGLGKTTLAHIIAHEMSGNLKVSAAPTIEKGGDLAAILTNLNEGDLLFIDEIHRLSSSIEEILYPAMEDFRLDIIIGSGPAAQTIKINLSRFTLIGATTKIGMLTKPLRERFGMTFRLEFYNNEELAQIIMNASIKLNKKCQKEAALEIAKRSRGTPRIALRLLKRVRDFADVAEEKIITNKTTLYALNELGVNELGFDALDIKYLQVLSQNKKPMGLNAISAAISEDGDTIEDLIEPYLFAHGFIERTARGRIATHKAHSIIFNMGLKKFL